VKRCNKGRMKKRNVGNGMEKDRKGKGRSVTQKKIQNNKKNNQQNHKLANKHYRYWMGYTTGVGSE
jgi:hypothetical protein